MRVINCLFDDRYGGPPKRVISVAKELAKSGIITIIFLPDRGGNVGQIAIDAGLNVAKGRISATPRLNSPFQILKWLVLLPRDCRNFIKIIKDTKPDIVHVNGAFFLAPAVAAKYCKLPIVWHLNDTVLPKLPALLFGRLVQLMATRVVVAANAVAAHYGINKCAYETIYAPVDTSACDSKSTDKANSHKISNSTPLRVGLIANWNPLKGIEYFVQGIASFKKKSNIPIEVVLAGQRLSTHLEYSKKVDNLIDKNNLRHLVHDYGFVSSVESLLSKIDVLVMSSISEACPMVVLEAMAAGVPVIASDVGGVREILCPGTSNESGIVIPSRDYEAVANSLLQMLNTDGLVMRLSANGKKMAQEKFSLQTCVEMHKKVYDIAM